MRLIDNKIKMIKFIRAVADESYKHYNTPGISLEAAKCLCDIFLAEMDSPGEIIYSPHWAAKLYYEHTGQVFDARAYQPIKIGNKDNK